MRRFISSAVAIGVRIAPQLALMTSGLLIGIWCLSQSIPLLTLTGWTIPAVAAHLLDLLIAGLLCSPIRSIIYSGKQRLARTGVLCVCVAVVWSFIGCAINASLLDFAASLSNGRTPGPLSVFAMSALCCVLPISLTVVLADLMMTACVRLARGQQPGPADEITRLMPTSSSYSSSGSTPILITGPDAGAMSNSSPARSLSQEAVHGLFWCGAAVGVVLLTLGTPAWLSAWMLGILCVMGLGALLILADSRGLPEQFSTAVEPVPMELNPPTGNRLRFLIGPAGLLGAACLGGCLGAIHRLSAQLFPISIQVLLIAAAGLCLGLACSGVCFSPQRMRRANRLSLVAMLLAGCAICAGMLVGFPALSDLSLWMNMTISRSGWLFVGRGLILAVPVCAVTILLGLLNAVQYRFSPARGSQPDSAQGESRVTAAADTVAWQPPVRWEQWASVVVGCGLSAWVIAPSLGLSVTLCASAWGVACCGLVLIGLRAASAAAAARPSLVSPSAAATVTALSAAASARWQKVQRWGRICLAGIPRLACAAGLTVLLLAPFQLGTFNSATSARSLFSTTVFNAARLGFQPDELLALDEGRLLQTVEDPRGIYTVWKFAGQQLQIRENGLPKGVISTDDALYPQFSAEVLQAVIPLSLHPRPERVLLLGLGSGQSLRTALTYPIRAAVCVEPDQAPVQILRTSIAQRMIECPLDDERVELAQCDPIWAVRSRMGAFDVIVSAPDHQALLRSPTNLIREFYRHAAANLQQGGIFAQRFNTVDLGPKPLAMLMQTLAVEFREVMAFETAPHELLLVASNAADGLVRPKLIERLQAAHTRRILAGMGMDWSVLLTLPAFRHDALMKLASEQSAGVSTAWNPALLFELSSETYDWSPKFEQMRTAMAPLNGRLANWVDDDPQAPEVVRRLAEVKGQHDLMVRYADQYWAYRASLRDQVSRKPRSLIQQTSATQGGGLHPEDRSRIQYFKALSKAIKTRQTEDIARLESFERPYDPLLSFFVHAEVAEIQALAQPRPVRSELRHRLHTIYFALPQDRSVRAVVETLKLLEAYPDAEPDPRERWELQSALLQALQSRWESRAGQTPTNVTQTLAELDASLVVAEHTFEQLARNASEAGVTAEEWDARRRVLDRRMIAPLQRYRRQLVPRQNAEKIASSQE